MEELARVHIRFFRTALFSAIIIAGLTAQGLLSPYLYLGYPDVNGLAFKIFLPVALTALISSILGALMSKAILKIGHWKNTFTKTNKFFFVFIAGILVALIAFFLNPQILGSGKFIMTTTLFTSSKYSSFSTAILRIIGPVIAFNTGAAGGIFAPSLGAGAAVGSFIASQFHYASANANILILSGMVGFLTGVTRTPFTSAILVLEMTDRHNVIFHLLLSGLLSYVSSMIIEKHSLYEELKKSYLPLNTSNSVYPEEVKYE